MRHSTLMSLAIGALLAAALAATDVRVVAAQRPTPFPSWSAPTLQSATDDEPPARLSTATHQTGKGLLIGAGVGAAAATLFLVAFCSGSDTSCQIDEVARAMLIIGAPFAVAGALIGALVD